MPHMDGFAVLERLLANDLTAGIPRIVLSADTADRARVRAMRGGAAYFVEKPYEPRALLAALTAAMRAHDPLHEWSER